MHCFSTDVALLCLKEKRQGEMVLVKLIKGLIRRMNDYYQ